MTDWQSRDVFILAMGFLTIGWLLYWWAEFRNK